MEILSEILNECGLICPYEEVLIVQLSDACKSFLESVEVDESVFSDWVECYRKGDFSVDIKTFVEKYAQEKGWVISEFPNCVWKALTFYVVYIAIDDTDDKEQKSIFSCSLQNQLLACKGHWDTLNFQNHLVKLYGNFRDYLNSFEQGVGDVDMSFISDIFDGSIDSLNLEGENLSKLENMGKFTWFYKLDHFWDDKEFSSERNAFLKVFYFLNFWGRECPSIYIHMDLKDILRWSGISNSKAKKSLRQIVGDYKSLGQNLIGAPISKSSIILRLVNDSLDEDGAFLDEKLTATEFFVYLYYEVLLELKLRENG